MRIEVDGQPYDVPDDATTAEIDAITRPSDKPGQGESFGRGAAQGATFGFGDEIQGALQAAGQKVLPESLGGIDYGKSFGDLYRENRDTARRENEEAQKENPGPFLAGNVAGNVVTLPLAPEAGGAARGVGLGARLLRTLGPAAALGGVNALGSSTADLTKGDVAGAAADTAIGAGEGAGIAGGSALIGQAIRPLSQALRDMGINAGRRVLSGVSNSLSNKAALPAEAVEEAARQGAFRPFGTTSTANEILENARRTVGQHYADVVAQLEAAGVAGPHAADLANQLALEGSAIAKRTLGSPRPGVFYNVADELALKPTDASGNLGLTQAEDMKRELQHLARSQYDKLQGLQTPRGEAQEAVAARLREANEAAIDAQRGLAPDAAAQFQPVKEQLGNVIQASNAARAGANRALRRNAIGINDVIAAAGPAGPLGGVLMHALRTRGASTAAAALLPASEAIAGFAPGVQGSLGQQLIKALGARAVPLLAEQAGENSP